MKAGRVELATGDVLVMYSDGITEAEDALERPFDEAGVQGVVDGGTGRRPRSSAGRCLRRRTHRQERRLLDDLTVLVARRLPPLPVAPVAPVAG